MELPGTLTCGNNGENLFVSHTDSTLYLNFDGIIKLSSDFAVNAL